MRDYWVRLLVAGFAAMSAAGWFAQGAVALVDTGEQSEARSPLSAFAFLPGAWSIRPFFPSGDGLTEGRTGESTIEAVFGGAGYQGTNRIPFHNDDLEMRNLLTYDAHQEVFRFVALDKGTATLDVYEGRFDDGALEVDNLRSGVVFVTQDGREFSFKLRWYDLSEDRFRFDVFWSDDRGETWSLYAEHIYERR
ncbi:MAG: hypothetical protein AAGI89_09045 [Pseudomonadota bacterium]